MGGEKMLKQPARVAEARGMTRMKTTLSPNATSAMEKALSLLISVRSVAAPARLKAMMNRPGFDGGQSV